MTTATLIENISLGLAYRFVIMLGSMTALRQTWCRRVLQLDPHAAGDCVPLLCIGHPDQSDPLPPAKPHLTEKWKWNQFTDQYSSGAIQQ